MAHGERARCAYVDGEWRDAEPALEIRNPARPAEVVATYGVAGDEDVRDAFAAARTALPAWRARPGMERAALLHRAANLLEERAERIATDLTREEGKPITEARGEVARGVSVLRYFAGEVAQPAGEVYPSAVDGRFLFTLEEPLGVVGVITPWNFPVAIPLWKIAPALAFANVVVWKPAEITPISSAHVMDVLADAGVPPGVVNLVIGPADPVGRALVDAPELDGISFTGSNAVGSQIRRAAAERGVKVQLELGGKNPVVVLPDADLDLAVRETVRGAMSSAGQKCTATSRAIVVGDSAADAFAERLVPAVDRLVVGDPLDAATDVGPLASAAQRDRVAGYLDLGRRAGLSVAAGGDVVDHPDGGWFVEPTVYLDVPPDSPLAREEIFGPVLGVIPAGDVDEAIAIANAVDYGLSASVFTRDIGAALRFVRAAEAGLVHVNADTTASESQVPFGGMKASSSHSREQGRAARSFFTEIKTAFIDPPSA